jgi:hypothetical protein
MQAHDVARCRPRSGKLTIFREGVSSREMLRPRVGYAAGTDGVGEGTSPRLLAGWKLRGREGNVWMPPQRTANLRQYSLRANRRQRTYPGSLVCLPRLNDISCAAVAGVSLLKTTMRSPERQDTNNDQPYRVRPMSTG